MGRDAVFSLRAEPERFLWLNLVNEADFSVLHDFNGVPVVRGWTPLRAEPIREKAKDWSKSLSDFPVLGSTPCFSQRAVDALLDVLVPNGELLPLECSEGRFFVYNVTTMRDVLDEDRSELVRFKDGRVMHIRSWAFRDGAGNAAVFKVPQSRVVVLVTSAFADRVAASGLTGFQLTEVGKVQQQADR